MSGSGSVELLSIIRSSLDASGYMAGARQIEQANARIWQSGEKVAAGQEKITRGMEQTARSVSQIVMRTDPAAKALVELTQAQTKFDRAVRLGLMTQEQATKALRPLEDAYRKTAAAAAGTTNAFGVNARQAQQLAPQINDVITSLLGGASAFQVMTQQGGQITQVMGGVGNTFRALGALFTPQRTAILAVGAALGTTLFAYESTERRVAALRQELRGYTSDYETLARTLERRARAQSETLPGVSTGDVRTAQTRLAQVVSPEDRENLERYVRLAVDLAATLDKDVSAAADRVARALRRPAEVASDLANRGVRGFDEQFRRHIELLELAGRRGEATAEVIARLEATFRGASQDGSTFQRAISNLEKAFESLWNRISDGLNTVTGPFLEWLAASQRNANVAASVIGTSLLRAIPGGLPLEGAFRLQQMLGPTPSGTQSARPTPAADIAGLLEEAARVSGVDRALLERVQRAEGVRNPDGSWRTSTAGARGPMQVMPGTFEELARRYGIQGGIDDPRANMLAGALYLRERLQTRGDVALALADYNAGPGRVDRVLGGQAELPNETARYVRGIRSGYSGSGITGPVQPVTPAPAPGQAATAPAEGARPAQPAPAASAPAEPAAALSADQRAYQAALAEARRRGTTVQERQDLEAQRARFEAALRQAPPGSAEYRELQEAIEGVNSALTRTERPVAAFIRSQQESARIASTSEGAARELAQAYQGLEEAARAEGRAVTPEEREQVRAAVMARQIGQYRDLTEQVDRQIVAEEALAAAISRGVGAMQEQEARARAIEDVRRAGLAGTAEEAAAVEALTQRYLRLARAQADRVTATALEGQRRQIEVLRQERDAAGLPQSERVARVAEIRARAELEQRQPGSADTPTGQEFIRNAVEAAGLQEDIRIMKEAEGYGREIAGVLVSGLRGIALEGQSATDVLRNMERALLELGTRALVLKPLEDLLGRISSGLMSGGGGGILGLLGIGGSAAGGAVALAGKTAIEGGLKLSAEAAMQAGTMVSFFHAGGEVGADRPTRREVMPAAMFVRAPRLHGGGGVGGPLLRRNEMAAVLEAGERVMTGRQQDSVLALMKRLAGASVSGVGRQPLVINQTIRSDDPGAFNRSRGQIATATRRELSRAVRNA